MTPDQLAALLTETPTWAVAVIHSMVHNPVVVDRQSKLSISNYVLRIVNEDGRHPYKLGKDELPLPCTTEVHLEIAHIQAIDYFTEKKIIPAKKPSIIVP